MKLRSTPVLGRGEMDPPCLQVQVLPLQFRAVRWAEAAIEAQQDHSLHLHVGHSEKSADLFGSEGLPFDLLSGDLLDGIKSGAPLDDLTLLGPVEHRLDDRQLVVNRDRRASIFDTLLAEVKKLNRFDLTDESAPADEVSKGSEPGLLFMVLPLPDFAGLGPAQLVVKVEVAQVLQGQPVGQQGGLAGPGVQGRRLFVVSPKGLLFVLAEVVYLASDLLAKLPRRV